MAKTTKNAVPDDLEKDLIQGAKEAAGGNPGHESQSESTATPEDLGPAEGSEQVSAKEAAQANLELPKMVSQDPPKKSLPLMVPESQVLTQTDLQKAAAQDNSPMYLNDPADISPDVLHASRVKKYGEDYVVVTKDKQQQVFTRLAWNQMRGDKFGWREAVQIPPEIRNL